jgi:hypothetical protein
VIWFLGEFVKTLTENPMLKIIYNFPIGSRHLLSMAWEIILLVYEFKG